MTTASNQGITLAEATASQAAAAPGQSPPRRGSLLLFTGPAFACAGLGVPLYVALPEFYSNYVGISLATVGLIFMLVRLMDLVVDPFLGSMMDSTHSRFGRFRPWLVAAVPLAILATYKVFMAEPGASSSYLAIWLTALYLAYSMMVLSHSAWAGTLSQDYDQRSRIYGWMMGGYLFGMLTILVVPTFIAPLFPDNPVAGVHAMGWYVIAIAPLTIGLVTWRTPEPAAGQASKEKISLPIFLALMTRPAVLRTLIANFALAMGPAITGSLFIFFYRVARGFTQSQSTSLLLLYFVAGLLGAPIWGWAASKVGKHRALAIAAIHFAILSAVPLLVPKAAFIPTAVVVFIMGLAYAAPTILIHSMMADAADEAELHSGSNRIGMLFAMITSGQKIGPALAVGISFPILDAIGFSPKAGAVNSELAIHGLEVLFVAGPVLFSIVAAAALWSYQLDADAHRQVCDVLAKRASTHSILAVEQRCI